MSKLCLRCQERPRTGAWLCNPCHEQATTENQRWTTATAPPTTEAVETALLEVIEEAPELPGGVRIADGTPDPFFPDLRMSAPAVGDRRELDRLAEEAWKCLLRGEPCEPYRRTAGRAYAAAEALLAERQQRTNGWREDGPCPNPASVA